MSSCFTENYSYYKKLPNYEIFFLLLILIKLNTQFSENEETKYTPHPNLMELTSYMSETSKLFFKLSVHFFGM